ncbi:MAG: hypothetical protein H6738_19650 [Alphaproteobacteria bacterium]|nr:hypothetical protein [Alphaproteobacteria bacterium]
MLLLLAALGCSVVAPEPVQPASPETLDALLLRLEEAGQLAATDRHGALDAWNIARARFDEQVEPGLRATSDPLEVTATEYTFARIHRELSQGRDASAEIEQLAQRLRPTRLATR